MDACRSGDESVVLVMEALDEILHQWNSFSIVTPKLIHVILPFFLHSPEYFISYMP